MLDINTRLGCWQQQEELHTSTRTAAAAELPVVCVPSPSAYKCPSDHEPKMNDRAEATQTHIKWVTDGKTEAQLRVLPQPGRPATCSAAFEGRRSHAQRTPRSPQKSCQGKETDDTSEWR